MINSKKSQILLESTGVMSKKRVILSNSVAFSENMNFSFADFELQFTKAEKYKILFITLSTGFNLFLQNGEKVMNHEKIKHTG